MEGKNKQFCDKQQFFDEKSPKSHYELGHPQKKIHIFGLFITFLPQSFYGAGQKRGFDPFFVGFLCAVKFNFQGFSRVEQSWLSVWLHLPWRHWEETRRVNSLWVKSDCSVSFFTLIQKVQIFLKKLDRDSAWFQSKLLLIPGLRRSV